MCETWSGPIPKIRRPERKSPATHYRNTLSLQRGCERDVTLEPPGSRACHRARALQLRTRSLRLTRRARARRQLWARWRAALRGRHRATPTHPLEAASPRWRSRRGPELGAAPERAADVAWRGCSFSLGLFVVTVGARHGLWPRRAIASGICCIRR